MRTVKRKVNAVGMLVLAMLWMLCVTASADSGDNSLYSLGLQNASSVSPEFYYSTLEYDVTVPAGTKTLELDPVTSAEDASIIDISGTELDANGTATVYITVEAANGAQVSYVLHVTSEGEPETTAPETEISEEERLQQEMQKQSESEEKQRRESELTAAQQQADKLSAQNRDLTNRINILMRVLYGLVGFAVLLLFFMINQSLRNKDLKDDLKEARSQADMNNEFARKEQSMQNGYYYNNPQAPTQNMQPNMRPVEEASRNVQAAFGNASQVLHAQPVPGQVNAPQQEAVLTQPTSAPAPAPAQQEPVLVQGQTEEPDVNVEMIDL